MDVAVLDADVMLRCVKDFEVGVCEDWEIGVVVVVDVVVGVFNS